MAKGFESINTPRSLYNRVRRLCTPDSCLRIAHAADFYGLAVGYWFNQLGVDLPSLPGPTAHLTPQGQGKYAKISLPLPMLESIRALVAKGAAKSVDGFVNHAVESLLRQWLLEPAVVAPYILHCTLVFKDGRPRPYGSKEGVRLEEFAQAWRGGPSTLFAPIHDSGGPICCIMHREAAIPKTRFTRNDLPDVKNVADEDQRAQAIATWMYNRLTETQDPTREFTSVTGVAPKLGFTRTQKSFGMDAVPLSITLNPFLGLLRGDPRSMQDLVEAAMRKSMLTIPEWLDLRARDPFAADRMERMWMQMLEFLAEPAIALPGAAAPATSPAA